MGVAPGTEIVCPACGWRNEQTARMCGGCGTLLPSAGGGSRPDATVALPAAPVAGIAGPLAGDDATTVYAPATPGYGQPPPYVPPTSGPAAWGAAPRALPAGYRAAPGVSVGRTGRRLLVAALLLVVLACGGLGAWSVVARPVLHERVDGALSAALDTAADNLSASLSALPPGVGGTAEIPAAEVNDLLAQHLPANVPVRDVVLRFANGGVRVHYSLLGRDGAVATQLSIVDGRLVAQDTAVFGPLRLVETGAELQHTLAEALARLPRSITISRLRVSDDALFLTVQAAG